VKKSEYYGAAEPPVRCGEPGIIKKIIGAKTLYKYREICKIIYKKGTERKSEMKLKKWSSEGGFKGKS